MDHFINSRRLSSFRRFDVFVKTLFASSAICGSADIDPAQIYYDHLKYWNGFKEACPRRNNFQDFLNAFGRIIAAPGPMDLPAVALAPSLNLMNGSHRLSNAIEKQWPVKFANARSGDGQDHVTIEYLESNGFLRDKPLAIANLLIKYGMWISKKQSLFVIWDCKHLEDILRLMKKYALLPVAHYTSELPSSSYTLASISNLVRLIYCDHGWMFDADDLPVGSLHKAQQIIGDSRISLIVVEKASLCDDVESLFLETAELKNEFRRISNTGHSALHSADDFLQTWAVCSSLFTAGPSFSIGNILNSRLAKGALGIQGIPDSSSAFDQYWSCAITGSTAMKFYGLDVKPKDLDMVCISGSILNYIYSHDTENAFYPIQISEIVSNPAYTYSHMGVRVVKPSVLLIMKNRRSEQKDKVHIEMLQTLLVRSQERCISFRRSPLPKGVG